MKSNTKLLRHKIYEAGFTPTTLASESQLNPSTLYNILNGRHVPSYYTIGVLTQNLNLSDQELAQIFFPRPNKSYPDQL